MLRAFVDILSAKMAWRLYESGDVNTWIGTQLSLLKHVQLWGRKVGEPVIRYDTNIPGSDAPTQSNFMDVPPAKVHRLWRRQTIS